MLSPAFLQDEDGDRVLAKGAKALAPMWVVRKALETNTIGQGL